MIPEVDAELRQDAEHGLIVLSDVRGQRQNAAGVGVGCGTGLGDDRRAIDRRPLRYAAQCQLAEQVKRPAAPRILHVQAELAAVEIVRGVELVLNGELRAHLDA